MVCRITFNVKINKSLGSEEVIGCVGSVKELGEWNIDKAILLEHDCNIWKAEVQIPNDVIIRYRYFTGFLLPGSCDTEKKISVTSWEASTQCRSLTAPDGEDFVASDVAFDSEIVDNGWLSHQSEVRFSVTSPKTAPFLRFFDSYLQHSSVDVNEIYVQPKTTSKIVSSKLILITPYNFTEYKDASRHRFQLPTTDEFDASFVVETCQVEELFVQFHILTKDETSIGIGVVACSSFPTSKGTIQVPLLDHNHFPIGMLHVPYLCIKPLNYPMIAEKCFLKHWKLRPMLHVGHRGSGNSFTSETVSKFRENSISSFNHAGANGASYVEFDVHLTKDNIPIIYHDLTTCLSAVQKTGDASRLLEVAVNQLTLNDVKSLRLLHKSRQHTTRKLEFDDSDTSMCSQPFPTLEEAFKDVRPDTGFNIEIKWPTLDEKHAYEDNMEHYIDANIFMDSILEVVFKSAGTRRIIFSSFDFDICVMCKRKQNRYPVLFLTNGDTKHYTPMLNVKEATNRMAIGAAKAEGFLGINTLSKDVHCNPDVVKKSHEAGLIFSCYGDDVGETLVMMNKASVDIAIYDRIYENRELTA